ncbi:MAG: sulfatase-like hydrolase/transferase [Deltaproteobacteria bacterium]|nr:sulfatase-like hydrolase/transferase [Deltaproteobacteria bacterium]
MPSSRRALLLTLVPPCVAGWAACGGGTDPPPPPENVLLVVLDDVGTRDVGTWGDPAAAPTPVLDGLVAEGMRFTEVWVSPVCSPSRASILTGRHGTRTGVGVKVSPDDAYELPEAEVTIAEALALSPRGYTSLAVGKWHLAGASDVTVPFDAPERQGFSAFAGSMGNLDLHSSAVDEPTDYFRWERCAEGACAVTDRYATTAVVDDALDLVADTPEPWFLYVAFNAAHAPYHAPPPGLNPDGVTADDSLRARYDAMVSSVDAELGRLLDGLAPAVRARTTVVVIGDNGTPETLANPPDSAERVKGSVYEGGLRVPLVIAGPRVLQGGTRCDALVHGVDLLPTIAAIGGVSLDGWIRGDGLPVTLDGASLLPFLANPFAEGRKHLFTAFLRSNGAPPWPDAEYAVRDARFKLISIGGEEELYEIVDGRDSGPELLSAGPLESEAAEALVGLRDHLADALAVRFEN